MRITVAMGPFIPLPPGSAGAVERRWLGTAQTFAQRGHDVTMVSKRDAREHASTDEGVRHLTVPGFDQSQSIKRDLFKDMIYARRAMKKLPEADILVTNTFWLPVLAPIFRKRAGRVVVNVARFPKGQIKLYGRAHAFVAPSSSVARAIAEQTPGAEPRTVVIPNPIDIERFYPPQRQPVLNDPPVVLYTGRLNSEKGLDLLVNACAAIARTRGPLTLRIIGPSAPERGGSGPGFLDDLRGLGADTPALTLSLEDPIYERDELREAIWGCDVYAYPSCADKGESFGVAPLEAMACARPVVVSSLPCFTDFVDHDKTGLVFDHHAPDATERLGAHIERLLDDRKRADLLGRNAAQLARTINYDTVADRYLALFEALIAEGA